MNPLKSSLYSALAFFFFTMLAPAANAAQTLFENVTVIDGTGRAAQAGMSVLIDGDRIAQIRHGPIAAGEDVLRLDGQGKYLLPGLMDMHVHLRGARTFGTEEDDPANGLRALHGFLYAGFTTIFDAGNRPEHIFGLREKERNGEIVSPRIFAAGAIVTAPGGHGGFDERFTVDSWPEAKVKLDAHIAMKPDLLKLTLDAHGWGTRPLIARLDVDLLQHIIHYYNDHGIRTTIHASDEYAARQAIFAGIDTLAHPVIQGPVSDRFVKLMAAKKVPMVSTLTIGEGYSRLVEHPEFLDQPLYQAMIEPQEIERYKTEIRDKWGKRTWTTWMKVMTPVAQENLRQIDEAGGIIALGSDQTMGAASHREAELMSSGGIPNLNVIRIATLNAAIFLGKERELGSIEEGKLADLLLLDADPVADINNLKQINLVMKGGQVVNRAALDLPVNRGPLVPLTVEKAEPKTP